MAGELPDGALEAHGMGQGLTERGGAQDALDASEERYRSVVEVIEEGIILQEASGRIVAWNRGAERIFGVKAEEVLGRISLDYPWQTIREDGSCFPGSEHPSMITLRTGKPCHAVLMGVKRVDDVRWILVSTSPIVREGDCTPRQVAISFVDITERRRAEEALRESETRFQELFNHMADGVVIYEGIDEGRDFVFVDVNESGETLGKIRREEVLGRRVTEVFPDVERTGLLDTFRRVWKTGQPEHHPVTEDLDERVQQWVENYVYRLSSGLIVAIFSDISERHKAEEAVRESEEKYRLLYDNADDAIFIHDLEGRMLAVNALACERLGYTRAELMGMSINEVDSPEEALQVTERIERLRGEGHLSFETVHCCKNGAPIATEVNARLVTWEGLSAMMSICRDITGRKQAERALDEYRERLRSLASELVQAEDRERRRIATYLHDEVGQLLAAVRIKFAAWKAMKTSSARTAFLSEIEALIDRTIDETRTLTFELSPPILYELGLGPALEWLGESLCEKEGIVLTVRDEGLVGGIGEVLAGALYRIARELLLNTVKHAQAKHVSVSVSATDDCVLLTVEDDGVGMEPSRYAQVLKGVSGTYGLFSVRERLHHLGGTLVVKSNPGEGTRVIVTAPFRDS